MFTHDALIHSYLYGCESEEEAAALHASAPDEAAVRNCLQHYQKAGILFLRDAGDPFGVSLLAKKLAAEYGITFLSAGCPLAEEGKGGVSGAKRFRDAEDFRLKVTELRRYGADFVYLCATGLPDLSVYGGVEGESMDADLVRACIGIAHEEGIPIAVECSGAESVAAAVEAEADSVEHGWYADKETLRIWAEGDTVWVPSVLSAGAWLNDPDQRYPQDLLKRILDEQLWKVGMLAGWGGNIALGSNAGAERSAHLQSCMDEYDHLKEELDDSLDSYLQSGEVMLKWKFSAL